MSCLCEYYGIMENQPDINEIVSLEESEEELMEEPTSSSTQNTSNGVSASQMASLQAENWLLRKKLNNSENANNSLEKLIAAVIEKQHQISGEMYTLRNAQHEFQDEIQSQRDYHIMERNNLNCELNDVKIKLNSYKRELKEVTAENQKLINLLRSANEKIYEIGTRFLKYKSKYSGESQLMTTDEDDNDDNEEDDWDLESDESSISDDSETETSDSDNSTNNVFTD